MNGIAHGQITRRQLISGAGAAACALALNELAGCSGNQVTKLYRQHREQFPYSLDYLQTLISNGRVSQQEIGQLLGRQAGAGKLFALQAFALVRKIQANSEMSVRYRDFLGKAAELMLNGTITFSLSERYVSDVECYFDKTSKNVRVQPDKIKETNDTFMSESSLVHELVHAYQDQLQRSLPYSQGEVEAHLAQSDYLFHARPSLLSENDWLHLYYNNGNLIYKFLWPSNLVGQLTAVPDDSAAERYLYQARNNYLLLRLMRGAVDQNMLPNLARQVPAGAPFEAVMSGLLQLLETSAKELRVKPLREHLACQEGGQPDSLATCHPSPELIKYGTSALFTIIYIWKEDRPDFAREVAQKIYLGAWQDLESNLIGSALDRSR